MPVALLLAGMPLAAADPAVTARLEIPAAEINVIGDPVTLTWHFTNFTPKPMAFVWEACCRLNGRLTVSEGGVDLPRIPPGPAAAHAFAKPAIILPGKENAFESMLADWVFIQKTGRYEIRGQYVGVLPEQKPPFPRSVELWRGEADTAPIGVELVTVHDYLAQRERRAAQRGLDASVTGPDRFPPLGEIKLQLRVRNTGREPLTLQWPLDADLWVVDGAGVRVHRSPIKPTGPDHPAIIAPGTEWTQTFPIAAADLNGGPFGNYRVFVDFPGRGGRPRVPSSPHPIRWDLGPAETTALLNDAASESSAGPRNPPLRLLRQYLAALEPVLKGLSEARLSAPAIPLRRQLQLAACLRKLPVRAGRVDLRVEVSPGGRWELSDPAVRRCATGTPLDQLRAATGVRRHLGVEMAASLYPSDAATVADLQAVAAALSGAGGDFAAPPRWVAEAPPNAIPGNIAFPPAPPPANLVLRLAAPSGRITAAVSRKFDAAPGTPSLVPSGDLMKMEFQPLAGITNLEALLADGKLPSPQTVIVADRDLRWDAVRPWLEPLLRRGWQMDLVVANE